MGAGQKAGGCYPVGDAIEVRFTYLDKPRRVRLSLKPNAANLKHARRQREQIVLEIKNGTFNFLTHFPDYKFAEKLKDETPGDARTFRDWFDVWAKLSVRDLEHATLTVYKKHMACYWLPTLGHLHPAKITHEKVLSHLAVLASDRVDAATNKPIKAISRKTQNNILIPLRGVFEMIARSPGWTLPNPAAGIDNLKVQQPEPDPFSMEEIELALSAIRAKSHGAVMADYFEFACFAGLRPSEQIALLWEDVDLRTATVRVRRARVMAKDKERTKTNVERSVELNSRAAAVLQRQRSRTQAAGDVVFRNPNTDRGWNDEQKQGTAWQLALRSCGIRHRPPKELRDTSVTLALTSGADPWWVAQQHGHSLQVMLKSYAKWMPQGDRGRNRDAVNKALATGT